MLVIKNLMFRNILCKKDEKNTFVIIFVVLNCSVMLNFVHRIKTAPKGIKMTETKDLNELRATYARVSEIIGKQTEREMRAIPIETLANASIRGTRIHSYCSSYLKGLWIPDVEEEYQPYFNAFTDWADANVIKTLHQNIRLYDDEKRFTGEFDVIALLNGWDGPVLIDIKTSSAKSRSWPVQLAAYKKLCQLNGYEVNEVVNVHLKKKKSAVFENMKIISPSLVEVKELEYESLEKYLKLFESALLCYDYFERKEN